MDNNNSEQLINNNIGNQQNQPPMNPFPTTNNNSIENKENTSNLNPNYNATNPLMPPQNQAQYPYNAPPQLPQNSYPYQNAPQGYPNNQNIVINQPPYNNDNIEAIALVSRRPSKCIQFLLLSFSIAIFIYLIVEFGVFGSKGLYFGNPLVIIDDIGIFVCGILFLLPFIYCFNEKKGVNANTRTIIIGVIWFVGIVLRWAGSGFSNMESDSKQIYLVFLVIRAILLFFSIINSIITGFDSHK